MTEAAPGTGASGAANARSGRRLRILLGTSVLVIIVVAVVLALTLGSRSSGPNPPLHRGASTTSVDISTQVDMADGIAHPSAIVALGDARIEVLAPTVLRLEYSPSSNFENTPTVNVVDRRLAVPAYSEHVSGGWLTLKTSKETFRYKVGSGPFTVSNTSVTFSDGSAQSTVHPTWDWECTFGQSCQAGAATLSGGAQISELESGYTSDAGFIGDLLYKGASATWDVLGARKGQAELTFRYSNIFNIFGPFGSHTLDLLINGHELRSLVFPQDDSSEPWTTASVTTSLNAGTNSVELLCAKANSCDVNLDTLSVGQAGHTAPAPAHTEPLGGWFRGFDSNTYTGQTCEPGSNGTTCVNTIEPLHTDGLLDRAGWRLLDDTQSAVWTKSGWVQPRSPGGDVQDGYLFAYGQDYDEALKIFAQLTGPAPLLPRSIFGVWYSDYTPYSSTDIEDDIYPDFESNDVPLNTLSLDTDWKSPNQWDGWEWSKSLFPDPSAFLDWAHSHGINVTLNVHSSIADDDPKLPDVEHIAKTKLAGSDCTDDGPCKVWDWSSESEAESNFVLQQSFLNQGVSFWWLDWCCDDSTVSMPGVTPDSWIDHLYAQQMIDSGERGFVLARIGSSNANNIEVYPAGAWSDHTSTIAFTGDAWGTWTTLAAEVALTPDEATIGEPYVSDDIGSFLGPPPSGTQDTPEIYDRWVQFGTFQPILRMHSDDEKRLPWEYPQPVQGITESFLRLREELIPYTYTLAADANRWGMPISEPLYLGYPAQSAAYSHPDEYLYGPDVLVAPVITPGTGTRDVAKTTVWFPPGRWVDYFTGATFEGPETVTVSDPLSRMPVFVKAGGIVPEQSSSKSTQNSTATELSIKVYSGSKGSFDLYGDSGTGLGYEKGQSTETEIRDTSPAISASSGNASVTVGAAKGSYPGEPSAVGYTIDMVDLTEPVHVTLNGKTLPLKSGSVGSGDWYYDVTDDTVVVVTSRMNVAHSFTVVADGVSSLSRAEPPNAE